MASVLAADIEIDNGVLVLTDDNFDEAMAANPLMLVEFYAPWCGHCKKLEPEYSAAAEALQGSEPAVALAKVDATEHKKLAEKYSIQGFPTLFWFNNGEKMEYGGGRTKDTIVSWILKKSGPPSAAVSCAGLADKLNDSKFVLAYFGEESDPLFTEAHLPYATSEDNIAFVHASADCAAEHEAPAPGIMFFRTFEEPKVAYAGAADKESLMNFVKPLTVPTVFEFSEDMIEPIFGQQQSTLFLFTSEKEPTTAFSDAAFANKGKVLFSYSGVKDGIQERLAEFVGATEADLPYMMLLVPGNMKKFRCEVPVADATVEDITAFVDGVLAGDIKPHLKSEEPPVQDGPVTVIVGKTFEEIALDPTKDVLVKFYAPWCGHCKKLAPIWDKLGEEFAAVEDLVIAKFDATTNEADGVEVQSYPTLTFYPKDNKAGVPYEGGRELDDIKKWLEENSSALKSVPTEDL